MSYTFRPPPPPPQPSFGPPPHVYTQVLALLRFEDISGSARNGFTTSSQVTTRAGDGIQVGFFYDASGGVSVTGVTYQSQPLTIRHQLSVAGLGFAVAVLENAPAGTASLVVSMNGSAVIHAAVATVHHVHAGAGAVMDSDSWSGTATQTTIPPVDTVLEAGVIGHAFRSNTVGFGMGAGQIRLHENNLGASARKISSWQFGVTGQVTHLYTFGGSINGVAAAVAWRPSTSPPPPLVSGTGTELHGHAESATGRVIHRARGTEAHPHVESGSPGAVRGTATEAHGHAGATAVSYRVTGTEAHPYTESGTSSVGGPITATGTELHPYLEESGVRVTAEGPTEGHPTVESATVRYRVTVVEGHPTVESAMDRAIVRATGTEGHATTESATGSVTGLVQGVATEGHPTAEQATDRTLARETGTETLAYVGGTAFGLRIVTTEGHVYVESAPDVQSIAEAGSEAHGHTESVTASIFGTVIGSGTELHPHAESATATVISPAFATVADVAGPERLGLTAEQGGDFSVRLAFERGMDAAPLLLADLTPRVEVRSSRGGAVLLTLTEGAGLTTVGATLTVAIPASTLAGLSGAYWWDLWCTDGGGNVAHTMEGPFDVLPGVTQP